MNSDPWAEIESPRTAASITAHRVDADGLWNFFWGRDIDQKCLLILNHSTSPTPARQLPRLKGIDVSEIPENSCESGMMIWKLLDSSQRDIFHRLCTDIITSACRATSEAEAVKIAVARTWRWHHLLRGGTDGRLSQEDQKGLIGELLVLENHLLPCLPAIDVVSAWQGPLGSPKDFEIGRVAIEAKARRGTATPYISISSEHQLDTSGTDSLFLCVTELTRATSESLDGFNVTDVAKRIREIIALADDDAVTLYESLLLAAGFHWEDDYTDSLWLMGSTHLYHVDDEFPSITSRTLSLGVSEVKYSISLNSCEPFLVPDATLNAILIGNDNEIN